MNAERRKKLEQVHIDTRKLPLPAPEPVEQPHVVFGLRMARQVFEKRGNHTEAHIKEVELAVLLAVAFDAGQKAGGKP